MRLETDVEHYLCEQCDPRPVERVRLSVSLLKHQSGYLLSPFLKHVLLSSFLMLHVLSQQEVPMIPQPSYAQAGSIYYICLLRDDLVLHQGMETEKLATQSSCCLWLISVKIAR